MPLWRGKWDVSAELLDDLRSRFLEAVRSSPEDYHPEDVSLARENDWFLVRYLLHHDRDVKHALKMLKESLKFRKDLEVNGLKKEHFPDFYFDGRVLQVYHADKLNHPVLVMRMRAHIKNPETVRLQQQFMLYWVERAMEVSDWGSVCVLFDCTGASYKNVDLEMTRFILNTFKQYYPWGLYTFLVYNVPWFWSALWKLIKTWIPEKHVSRVVFVNSESILEYIDKEKVPVCMGGTCTDLYEPKDAPEESPSRGWF